MRRAQLVVQLLHALARALLAHDGHTQDDRDGVGREEKGGVVGIVAQVVGPGAMLMPYATQTRRLTSNPSRSPNSRIERTHREHIQQRWADECSLRTDEPTSP